MTESAAIGGGERLTTCVQALNQALHRAFAENPAFMLLGEDILDPYGGAFKASRGLSSAYPHRVFTTPISEAAIVGIAAGLSLRGFRPIVEIMFGDFISLAFDQILNGISKFRSMYNGQVTCPITIRTPMGGRRSYGPTHSQTLDKFLLGVPNMLLIAPSEFHDFEAVFLAALHDDSPKVIIENKSMYSRPVRYCGAARMGDFHAAYSPGPYPVCRLAIGGFERAEVTILAYGGMADLAVKAAQLLFMQEEITAEVVIPSRIAPVQADFLAGPLSRSGRLIIVEENTASCGYAAEAGLQASQLFWRQLRAPVMRLASPDDIIPACRRLENEFMVDEARIFESALRLIDSRR